MRNLLFIVLAMASLSLQLSAKTSEPVFFNILELFGSEDLTQIDPEVKSRLQSEIQTIIEHGGSPVGIAPVWVFPKSLGAPRVPPNNFASFEGVEPVRINCIPDFKADEYRKWSAARDRVFAALAAHFPEVTEWLVGFEPDQHVFCDCSGRQLGFEQYVRFAVDSLIGIRKAVKTANPHNSTIAHFLGSREDASGSATG